jgi:hypothetical protein
LGAAVLMHGFQRPAKRRDSRRVKRGEPRRMPEQRDDPKRGCPEILLGSHGTVNRALHVTIRAQTTHGAASDPSAQPPNGSAQSTKSVCVALDSSRQYSFLHNTNN